MPAAIPSRNSRSPRRAARPHLETLERRLVLAASATLSAAVRVADAAARVAIVGETLMVEGTSGPDRIRIEPTQRSETVRVVFDGKVLGSYGPIANIDVNAGAGNDTVMVDPRITPPTQLDGGVGNDRLRGGSGSNVLLGREGNHVRIGNAGRDSLAGGSGLDRLVAPKSLGVIQVGPSVSGEALRDLSAAYTFSPLRVRVAGPVVVGAANLRNGRIANLLRSDYNGGQAVALANATAKAASSLASLLGYPAPVALPDGVRQVDLVAFRKVNQGGPTDFSTSVVLPQKIDVAATPAQRQAGDRAFSRTELPYLEKVFSATSAAPPQPTGERPRAGPAPDCEREHNLVALAD